MRSQPYRGCGSGHAEEATATRSGGRTGRILAATIAHWACSLRRDPVPGAIRNSAGRTAALPAAALAACLLIALVLVAWPSGAEGQGQGRRVVVLGETGAAPSPACPIPLDECEAVGSVTGFQAGVDGVSQPFKAPFDGKIVAWGLTLSRPNAQQREFFNDFYAAPPMAQLAVLRRVPDTSPPQFKLVRKSPAVNVSPYLGSEVEFALEHPLTVLEDQVVGLTVVNWAPAFAVGIGADNAWRASRKRGECTSTRDIQESRPQVRVGSTRQYGCFYTTARLLYTATVVQGR
jgi:hypothetical protein